MPTVAVNGETLHYVKTGSGPAVVFVHYLGGFSGTWRRQISGSKDRFTCIAFDQRGYGFSSLNGRWGVEASADDLKAGLDALGVERAHFVGYSMGGPVMLSFGARWPGMVRSLMLIDTFAQNARHSADRVAESEKCLRYMSMRQYARQYAAARLMPDVPAPVVDALVAGDLPGAEGGLSGFDPRHPRARLRRAVSADHGADAGGLRPARRDDAGRPDQRSDAPDPERA